MHALHSFLSVKQKKFQHSFVNELIIENVSSCLQNRLWIL